jgi:hypothetical protein
VALVPQLAGLPNAFADDSGGLALDPSELGFTWDIELAPADAVIFLEPDRRGRTRLEPMPKYCMAERLMAQSQPPAAGARGWIDDICALLARAECYALHAPDLESAIGILKDALEA